MQTNWFDFQWNDECLNELKPQASEYEESF